MDVITLTAAKGYTDKAVEKIIESDNAGTIVDPTLSISGAAADAKITGDKIALLSNYVTPQMFGAVGDGVTDDTEAVQAALDKGGLIYFPAGRYKVTSLLTASKSCRIEMFKQYPNCYHPSDEGDYPLTDNDNWMGARIDTYSPDGGIVVGASTEIDGFYMRAMSGFSGILFKFDEREGLFNYPGTVRLSHIRLDIESRDVIPEAMFDFIPKGSYRYFLEDINIGRRHIEFCEYGFRADLSQVSETNWANDVFIRGLCVDCFADYPLYVDGAKRAGGWQFDGLTIQAYPYDTVVSNGYGNGRTSHADIVTLKNLQETTFLSCHLWDLFQADYNNIFTIENVTNTSCIGCSPEFDQIESALSKQIAYPKNFTVKNLGVEVVTDPDTGDNQLTLSDPAGNIQRVTIPAAALDDEQFDTAVTNWMEEKSVPYEVIGKNKVDITSEDFIIGKAIGSTGSYFVNEGMCTTNYIEAQYKDIIRISRAGTSISGYNMACYDKDKNFLVIYSIRAGNEHGISPGAVEVIEDGTAYVRIILTGTAIGGFETLESNQLCITVNNPDVSYEPYEVRLEGGLGEFIVLQSENGSRYSVAVTDDGDVISKDEEGNLIVPEKPYITPQMFGAKADGVTDDTTAIQAMFDNVAGIGKVYFPHGNYLTTTPIVVEKVPDIEMDGVIMSNHAGVAFTLGKSGASAFTDKTIKLKIKKQGTKLEEGSVGLVIYSSARNTFYLDTVTNFETNVKLLSEVDKGIWFNTFHLNNLNHARYGLYLDGVDGWINDNLFIGGSISVNSDSTAIVINHGGSNVFLKQGLEGAGTCVHIISGSINTFLQARCERATYGLVIDEGKDNVMYSNYAKPEFINNSRYTTNGVIQTGIRGVCQHSAVSIDKLEDNRFFYYGSKVVPTYCKVINATSGNIVEEYNVASFNYENGAWMPNNYRPVFEFDTTVNKKFEFGGNKPVVRVKLFDVNGGIKLTEDNMTDYIITDQITAPTLSTNFGGDNVHLTASYGFEVSEEVVKIELIYLDNAYGLGCITHFDIRTEFPCYPIRDEVLTLPQLPDNGYVGAKIIYNNRLYTYDGTKWVSDVEIAEQAASLIDAALLSALGSGVIE